MARLKRNVRDLETPTENNVNVTKKQKKKDASNEIIKYTFTSKQNNKKKKHASKNKFVEDTKGLHDSTKYSKEDKKKLEVQVQINIDDKTKRKMKNKNKYGANKTEKSDICIKYLKDDNKTSEVLEKANSKTKGKMKNNKRKQNTNLDLTNKHAVEVSDAKERSKNLQMPVKESVDFESKKTKIEKFKKMTEKKMKRMLTKTETQEVKPDEILKLNKHMMKIKQLEEMLIRKSQAKQTLKDRVMAQLTAVRFRSINEMLCDNNSSQSKRYFKENPNAFKAYQMGYKWQLEQWPLNPLDVIISSILELPLDNVIADFGCGEARLAISVPHTVHSFDFVALNDRVKACDMAHTPLRMNSVDVVVFSLSLMGSNLNDYIMEANRVLKIDGILKIAEIGSRFEDIKDFIRQLRNYGFKNTWKDLSYDLFYFLDFKKEKDINMKKKKSPSITLKSCLYKKR
ncbi:ribosomal RNA-processing protein 8 [Monomorium pharaonis]|uniref:ribosomal RNA-processing protein 8 n=1 Tax=Monomorium pharaonis TaxID=307658 RepID=UPI00102E1931|nr:ribosomal RNA-processing protein 8 [Monomorium pharaonis]